MFTYVGELALIIKKLYPDHFFVSYLPYHTSIGWHVHTNMVWLTSAS